MSLSLARFKNRITEDTGSWVDRRVEREAQTRHRAAGLLETVYLHEGIPNSEKVYTLSILCPIDRDAGVAQQGFDVTRPIPSLSQWCLPRCFYFHLSLQSHSLTALFCGSSSRNSVRSGSEHSKVAGGPNNQRVLRTTERFSVMSSLFTHSLPRSMSCMPRLGWSRCERDIEASSLSTGAETVKSSSIVSCQGKDLHKHQQRLLWSWTI